VKEARISGSPLDCTPKEIRLTNGKGFAVCSGSVSDSGNAYNSIASIRLSYNYRESLPKKEITIINIK
jgi:hypothetical protein